MSDDVAHMQSYIFYEGDWFFVDTYDRDSSAALAHGDRYAETQVWEWRMPERERGKLLATYSSGRGSVRKHMETIDRIHRSGKEGLE